MNLDKKLKTKNWWHSWQSFLPTFHLSSLLSSNQTEDKKSLRFPSLIFPQSKHSTNYSNILVKVCCVQLNWASFIKLLGKYILKFGWDLYMAMSQTSNPWLCLELSHATNYATCYGEIGTLVTILCIPLPRRW